MADGTNIVPSGPPWEPVDVDIMPDGPPWEPFDVPIYFDGPPWNPIDVPIYPSLPPWLAQDVPTYPDGPPWEPFDVPVVLDPPPWGPVDVPTVQTGPAWEPNDVPTPPAPTPWSPTDVPTAPSDAPWDPVDVSTSPSGPAWTPTDVPVALADPPMGPMQPPHGTPPPWVPNDVVTTSELSDRLRSYDRKLSNFLDTVGEVVPFVSAAGKGAFDPLVLADWLRNYKDAVGVGGMAKFIAEQTALYAMNPVVARFFDPTYFARLAIPGYTGMFNTHVELGPFESYTNIAIAKDQTIVGTLEYRQQENIRRGYNVYDYEHQSTEIQDFTVDEMVDARTSNPPRASEYLKEEGGIGRFNASKYFEDDKTNNGGQRVRGTTKGLVVSGQGQNVGASKLAKSAATNGIIRIPVPGDGTPKQGGTVAYDGVVLSDTTIPDVDDDDVRLPLCFTDLRKDPASDSYRHVFFQPMNLVVNESFNPNWNETQAFGRVDQMVGYVGTSRTWSVSFECHAFVPEDLAAMYHKMTWLTSMVYPTYGSDALLRSGPVCRMRIGDLAATSEGGIPGVIRSLSFDFAECLWELKRGMKVPRSFGVQLDYMVLHDGPVGILNGMFGVLQLPGPTTNLAGPNAPSQESGDAATKDSVSISSGRWARFGEPSRKG